MARVLTWTDAEDEVIRKLYPEGGATACLPYLKNRTADRIRGRAHRIKVISTLGESMKKRMEPKEEGPYPWPPLDPMTLALQNFGFITRTGQLRPIVTVELEEAA